MDTLQDALPLQAPLQPLKVQPDAGVALNCTAVPDAKFAEQVPAAQVRPLGALFTVPLPVTAADNAYCVV